MAYKTRGTTRRSRWLLGAALFSIALVFALVPATGLAANPAANLDQCGNDPLPSSHLDGCDTSGTQWVNGNLGASKSVYFEGDSIPYRITLTNLAAGSHTVTIEWDTTKSSKHAIDYIDSYNASVADANPCLGVTGCNAGTFTTFAIPKDPQDDNGSGSPISQAPGVMTLFGGTITGLTTPSTVGSTTCNSTNTLGAYCYSSGKGFTGDKSAAITVQFTGSGTMVLAWGGHIATRHDWGLTNSAVSISGSPYHTRLIDLDGSGGNQDRSLSADAVIFPGFIHIIKNATGGSASFPFTASPSPLSNFTLNTAPSASCAAGVTSCAEQDFDNITNFQTYTVTEGANPANWAFDNATCTVASPNGGTQTVNGKVATIALNEGEEVTCIYANHHTTASPTLTTQAGGTVSLDSTGHATISDSATLSGGSNPQGSIQFTVSGPGGPIPSCTQSFPVNGNGTYGPATCIVTHAGTYTWSATYTSSDNNNNNASDNGQNESEVVGPAHPTLTTQAGGTVSLDATDSATISDSATLSGGANPQGTITFTVSGPGGPIASCTQTVPVNGNGTYGPATCIVTHAGTYTWSATYTSSNADNANASDNGQNESEVVGPANPTLTTQAGGPVSLDPGTGQATISDTATLSGGANPQGTITFTVSGPGGPIPSCAQTVPVNGNGTYGPVFCTVTDAGTYTWSATYTSSNSDNTNASDNGQNESEVVGGQQPILTTQAGGTVSLDPGSDSATISDTATLSNGANPQGTITFTVTGPGGPIPSCTQTVPVNGNGTYGPVFCTVSHAGTYTWSATYTSSNANNTNASDNGQNESEVVGPANPTLTTQAGGTVQLDATDSALISDTATLSGGANPQGTITFTVSGPGGPIPSCTQTVPVNGNGTYGPATCTVADAGTYTWSATYTSSNADNTNASDNGQNESEVVGPANPTLTTQAGGPVSLDPSTGQATISDTATLSGGANPQGSITFTVSGPGGPIASCTQTVPVNGNGTYGPVFCTVTDAGTYTWSATYISSNANNTNASDNGQNESEVVGGQQPILTTQAGGTVQLDSTDHATISDTATLSNGANPQGTITFTVSGPGGPIPACAQTVPVNGNGTYGPVFCTVTDAGTYTWSATYTSSNNNNSNASDNGQNESEVVGPANPTLTTQAGGTVSLDPGTDSATISDSATLSGGANPQGTITFTVSGPGGPIASCTQTVPVNGNGTYGPATCIVTHAGTYTWSATYTSSNANNTNASDNGQNESEVVGPANPTLTTQAGATVQLDLSGHATISDTATLSGGANPQGSITFTVSGPGGPIASCTQTVPVNGNGTYGPATCIVTQAGTYTWSATYTSSNADNANASDNGANESEVVTNPPHVSQITPTQTTCSQFANGTASTLGSIQYSLKGSASKATINQVNPGVLFYWVKVSGSGPFTITQSIGPAGETLQTPFALASGSFAYTANCQTTGSVKQNADGSFTVTGSNIAFIGIKLDPSTVVGKPAPNPSTAVYTFSTTGVPGSSSSVNLSKK